MSLIITEKYLKENSVINDNADMKIITPTIKLVQKKYIHPLLGTQLYSDILSEITAASVSTAYQTLLDEYLVDIMLFYTLCECTPVFQYRYMNKGIMKKSSENSQPADLQEIIFMMDKWKRDAEQLSELCTKFLYYNVATYPKFANSINYTDTPPNTTNYTSGLSLDDPNDGCCYFKYR